MLRFTFVSILILLAAISLGSMGGYAQSSGPSSSLVNGGFSSETNESGGQLNTPGASNGRPLAQVVGPVYNFGNVYNGTTVKHTFRLKNAGTAPLTIGAVRTSCGCTAAQPTKSNLLPGEDSLIVVSFDTHADHGPATRTITVFTNDPNHQQLQLTMRGDVKVQVEASPSLVIFERIKRGTQQSRQVTLTDEMPDAGFKVGAITNANPNIRVTSQPIHGAKSAALLTITLLNTAPAGPITDLLKVNTSRVPVEIPVSGTVLGDIDVNPPQVSFGIVPHHASALRFVRLTNSGDHPVKVTAISSDNTSVVAAVEPVKTGKEYKIAVRLAPNTPDGVLRGILAIKTDDPHQQEVQIPFYGIVGSFKG
ncbi:MAG: DUF1573 domain-containing protein [Deltaproteobacteria bacterium]|nr:DUF1573 domain-containing protein [Deltaproteobacteria bacterium]